MKEKPAKTDHDIHPLIRQRWSPRMFGDGMIEPSVVDRLFEAVRWAASSSNAQPWRFIYAYRGSEAYDKIFHCLSDSNQKWVRNAPFLMLTAIQEKFDSGKENYHALHDLGLAMGNFTLQAQSMQIAVHQMAGVDWKKAHEVFGVPEGFHVATAVAVGYYGGDEDQLPEALKKRETAGRQRKKQSEFIAFGKWQFDEPSKNA